MDLWGLLCDPLKTTDRSSYRHTPWFYPVPMSGQESYPTTTLPPQSTLMPIPHLLQPPSLFRYNRASRRRPKRILQQEKPSTPTNIGAIEANRHIGVGRAKPNQQKDKRTVGTEFELTW